MSAVKYIWLQVKEVPNKEKAAEEQLFELQAPLSTQWIMKLLFSHRFASQKIFSFLPNLAVTFKLRY